MEEITETDFLNALEVIKNYRQKINNALENINVKKTTISDFLEMIDKSNYYISSRLANCLLKQNRKYKEPLNIEFIEDFTQSKFNSIINSGSVTWNEFCDLKKEFKIK